MTDPKVSPFRPDGVFFAKRGYIPKTPPVIGVEDQTIKYALMDLAEIVPFAFFHPRYIYVTRNAYLGEDRFVVIPTPGMVEMVALYVPIEIQNKWLMKSIREKPEQVIQGAVENFLKEQFRRYAEEI